MRDATKAPCGGSGHASGGDHRILTAVGNAGLLPFLYDIILEKERAESIGIYNAVSGISIFIGALLGSVLFNVCVLRIGFANSLTLCLVISGIGRLLANLSFFGISEPHEYPATVTEELRVIRDRLLAFAVGCNR